MESYHVPFLHKDSLAAAFRRAVLVYDEHDRHIRLMPVRSNFEQFADIPEHAWKILDHASVYYSFSELLLHHAPRLRLAEHVLAAFT